MIMEYKKNRFYAVQIDKITGFLYGFLYFFTYRKNIADASKN